MRTKHPKDQLKTTANTTAKSKKSALYLVSVYVILGLLSLCSLTACNPSGNTAPPPPHQQSPNKNALSSTRSLGIGRESAIFNYLAKDWQIVQINNIPTPNSVILNLKNIENGTGELSIGTHCPPIYIQFDTSELAKGIISTTHIERELNDCSDTFEDRLMSTLADLTYIEKRPVDTTDTLILSAYQDKILLTPAP